MEYGSVGQHRPYTDWTNKVAEGEESGMSWVIARAYSESGSMPQESGGNCHGIGEREESGFEIFSISELAVYGHAKAVPCGRLTSKSSQLRTNSQRLLDVVVGLSFPLWWTLDTMLQAQKQGAIFHLSRPGQGAVFVTPCTGVG